MTAKALTNAFLAQAGHCDALGSPFMGRLCRLFAQHDWPETPLRDLMVGWEGDVSSTGQSLPLRLAGGLHALVLNGDKLGDAYPPHVVTDDTLWNAVCTALVDKADVLADWLTSAPQTNEVRRAAVLIGVGRLLAQRFGLPLRLSELGASGGLNLMWDQFALDIGGARFGPADADVILSPVWEGHAPPDADAVVVARRGVDLNPFDPHDQDDQLRLRAFLWVDQPERMTRTQAAIATCDAIVDHGDAVAWLEDQLTHHEGICHLVYHTVAWQYFPADAQARGTALIEAAGASATAAHPLAWFGMEADGNSPGAALTLRIWPGDITLDIGRADFHGRWVHWKAGT
ncbi:MAG: DUF2332 family protein [Yoonia sp.]|nr:DUF2332 family protein [Yoonia sp.]